MSTLNKVEFQYQYGDIVYRFDRRKKIIFGVVRDDSGLQKGQIKVEWNNSHRRSVWKQKEVRLMSRSIIPRDPVRRLVNGTETQRGYCREAEQFAAVQIVGTNNIIERVPRERLNVISRYHPNNIVCLDNKFGKLMSINQKIRMQSKCGSTVEIFSQNDIHRAVRDFWSNGRYFYTFDNYNYPGQEVICTPNDLEQPQWLHRSEVMKRSMHTRHRFTVQKVEPFAISVLWFNSGPGVLPFGDIKTEDIPRLKIVKPEGQPYLGLNQGRRLLKLNFSDVLLTKKNWIRKQSVLHQPKRHKVGNRLTSLVHRGSKLRCPSLLATYVKIPDESEEDWYTEEEEEEMSTSTTSNTQLNAKHFPRKLRELVPGNTVDVEVLCIDSKVTIVWENGTIEEDIPTTHLYRRTSLLVALVGDEHEFFPGEWVISDGGTEEYGTVQHGNNLERIATVKWFTHNEGDEKPQLVSTNEMMSAYDLRKHPKYKFRPGSVVKQIPIENEKFGTVLDSYPEGYVIVQWINGLQESCWPQNLELVDPNDYSANEIEEDNALPVSPATSEDSLLNPLQLNKSVISSENEVFTILDKAHSSHRFYSRKFHPTDKQKFVETVEKEYAALKESLPPGVWVRLYQNRMDLLSVMIEGPKNTPYEDGLFLFDFQLSQDYPLSPPLCYYRSYSSEQLSPYLYAKSRETWPGRGTEAWRTNSTLLQLLVSIQGIYDNSSPTV